MSRRVAALYDIHGNLPALEAVLRDVANAAVDEVVIGGDALLGPMPRETLGALARISGRVHFIRGNCDREMTAQYKGEPVSLPPQVRESLTWCSEQLSAADHHLIAEWPSSYSATIAGLGDVFFCHATPRSDTEIFTRQTPEGVVKTMVSPCSASTVVCGHTHMQFDRVVGTKRVVNAGSVGMPFGSPGAYWLLLGPDIALKRTGYDLEAAARRIRSTAYPEAESFAGKNVLSPPSEAAMLAAFSPKPESAGSRG